jgi:Mn-containing catalase
MITRFDQIVIDLRRPRNPSPNSAAAVQELLGGKFGEMSTFMNYAFQSFNFRGRSRMRPFYDLIANIATEEFSHIEIVSYTINLLLTGATKRGTDPTATPLASALDARNSYPIHDDAHRDLADHPAIDASHGDDAAVAACHDCFAQGDRPSGLLVVRRRAR